MTTLSELIGRRFLHFRTAAGLTQDHVSTAARRAGLGWGRSTIAQLEAGTKQVSAEELLLMPFVWLIAFDQEMTLPGLLGPWDGDRRGERVDLTPDAALTPAAAVRVLTGSVAADVLTSGAVEIPATRSGRVGPALERLEGYRRLWPAMPRTRLVSVEEAAAGEAEQKAARRLGVAAADVSVLAHRLWGRGLTAERDRRVEGARGESASPRSVQAARGHITRQLLAELEPLLKCA